MSAVRIALLTIRLVMRTKIAFFFTFIFPLGFLFVYAGLFGHGNPQAVAYMFGPVVTLNIMGSGFWGLGLQSVMQRERGSLRRYRLAPIGAGTMVSSSLLANYLLELPTIALMVFCAVVFFHMPLKIGLGTLLVLVSIGTLAFAGFGLTVASVANTMQEAQVYNNVVWLTLLFLSGTTVPLPVLPHWVQRLAAFLPATYLVSSFQGIMMQSESLRAHWPEMLGLTLSGLFGLLFAWRLFRWEKEERIPNSRKLTALLFLIPFLVIGAWMNARRNPTASWARSLDLLERATHAGKSASHSSGAKSAEGGMLQPKGRVVPVPPRVESGLVSDFDEGSTPTSNFGSGWVVSMDAQMGGRSTADMRIVSGGAERSKGALLVWGSVSPLSAYPWAGAMFLPGVLSFAPADLSSKKEISFWTKGDDRTYRLMLVERSLGQKTATQSFVAGRTWRQHSFPLSAFQGIDPHQVRGILFAAGPAPGKFRFQIDDVWFK